MTPLIILVILTSGFTFIKSSPLARFRQSRLSGQDSYSNIGVYGVVATCSAAVVTLILNVLTHWLFQSCGWEIPHMPEWEGHTAKDAISSKNLMLGVWILLSHGLAVAAGKFLSTVNDESESAAAMAMDDSLSKLLLESMMSWNAVQLTLSSRKVYVGISVGQLVRDDFSKHDYIELIPLISGYRDKDTLDLTLTCNYEEFYESWGQIADDTWSERLTSFRVVIPLSEIKSAAFFDPSAHAVLSLRPDVEEYEEEILSQP